MKLLVRMAAVLAGSLALVGSAQAQPILERIEGFVRDQIEAARPPQTSAEAGYLGMIGDDAQEGGRGVRVLEVFPEHAAAKGGLQPGDLITKIDDRQIRSMDSLGAALAGKPVGAKLAVTIERNGRNQLQSVTLGKRSPAVPPAEVLPEPAPATNDSGPAPPKLGVRTVPVTDEVQRRHNLTDKDGGHVISVTSGSPADRAGIPLGSVITAIDGRPVRSPAELSTAIREAGRAAVEVTYRFNGDTTQKMVQITSAAPLEQPPAELPPAELPPAEQPTTQEPGPQLEVRSRPPQPDLVAPAPVPDLSGHGARIEALEAKIQQLEARIKALEESRTVPTTVAPAEALPATEN